MKLIAALSLCFLACTARALDTDDFLDRVDAALSMAAFQDNVRLRLSGTIDLEGYHLQQPAPGLINSNIDNLFNPRITLFLDAQIGSQVYIFVQSRLDRGFDPSDRGAQVRLDEYALPAPFVMGQPIYQRAVSLRKHHSYQRQSRACFTAGFRPKL